MNLSHNTFDSTPRMFGVEQEHFVFHDDGTAPSHEEIDQLWIRMCRHGFQADSVNAHGLVLSVSRSLPQGMLVVTNDCCTHIIELALPPYRSIEDFRRDYCETWNLITEHLKDFGLSIRPVGSLPSSVRSVSWRPKVTDPEGVRLYRLVHRDPIDSPLFHPDFPAYFAATHVSLNVSDVEAIALLPGYYAFEFFVPLWFSTSPKFQSFEAHCVRPLAWEANYHKPYPLLGIPDPIPSNLEQYKQLVSQCSIRDYSFVSIRNEDRLEFRSACSQPTVDAVEHLIRFRMAVDWAVREGAFGVWNPRTAFENACTGRPVESYETAIDLLTPYFQLCGFTIPSVS